MLKGASGLNVSAGLGVAIWTGLGCVVALADSTGSGTSGSDSTASESSESASEGSTPASTPEDVADDEKDPVEDEADTDDLEARLKSKKSRVSTPAQSDADRPSAVGEPGAPLAVAGRVDVQPGDRRCRYAGSLDSLAPGDHVHPSQLAERRQILTVLTGRSGAPWAGLLPLL